MAAFRKYWRCWSQMVISDHLASCKFVIEIAATIHLKGVETYEGSEDLIML